MNETPKSRQGLTLALPLALIIGVLIGLLFGWYVWPVEWEGGTLEVLGAEVQEDVLRAYIDSHTVQPDDTLALARFNSLGDQKHAALARIWNDPGAQNPIDIQAFATAVGASATLEEDTATSEPAPASGIAGLFGSSLLTFLLVCTGLILLAIVGIILLARRRPARPAREATFAGPTASDAPALETSAGPEMTQPSAEPAAPLEGDLPDWLQQPAATDDPYRTVRLEEEQMAQVFELQEPPDLGATPPHGLPVDTTAPPTAAETAFMDEIFAERAAMPPESAPAPDTDDLSWLNEPSESQPASTTDDLSWLNEPASETVDSVGWRDTLSDAAEPTPEEMAPFELEAPAAETIPPAAETPPAEPYGIGIFDLPAPPARPEPLEIEETPEETFAKFSRDIASLKDLSPENADKLRRLGITVPLLLLKRGATAEGRRQIAADADIPEDQIYRWVRYIDLFRIKGVGQEYAELLESAGVETVAAVGRSDPDALYARLRQIADPQRLPASQVVAAWVAQAKKLPRSVTD